MAAAGWLYMTQHLQHARKAMTAIAAVLAFSSTPLLAQDTGTTPPVTDPAPEPAAPAADPLAPDPAPVETTATTTATKAAPAKPKAAATARRSAAAPRTAARNATRSPQPAPVAEAAAPVPPPAPAPAASAMPVAPGPMPVADPAPAVAPAANAAAIDMDEALPIAGGAALGLMLLAGAAAVRRRRRRKQDDADEAVKWAFIESHAEPEPAAAAEPAFVRAAEPRHDPVPGKTPIRDAPVTELPEDFDLSRFGPHVQAAYRGPTTDNPSLSLKYRLRRASFLDQQERRAAEGAAPKPRETVPATGNWESPTDSDFMFRRAGKSAGKPAFHH